MFEARKISVLIVNTQRIASSCLKQKVKVNTNVNTNLQKAECG